MIRKSQAEIVGRRAELLAELFLQDLGAAFVSRPTDDTGIDFIAAFPNGYGGTNLSAIEVKATEQPVGDFFVLDKKWYQRLAHSNVPLLLLVVDAKHNRLYYAWPSEAGVQPKTDIRSVRIPIAPVDEETKQQIRERLAGVDKPSPAGR